MNRVKFHDKAIQSQVLKGRAVRDRLDELGAEVAQDAAEDAGNGAVYEVGSFRGFDRHHTTVRTGNRQAMNAESKRRSLTRAASKKR